MAVNASISPDQALHYACAKGDLDGIHNALADGAFVNIKSPHMQDTPLHVAVMNGSIDAVHVLLDAGAQPNAQNLDGRTPLHEAAFQTKKPELWNTLLLKGADPDTPDREGLSPQSLRDALNFGPAMVEFSQEQAARGMSRSR